MFLTISLPNNNIYALFYDKNLLWIGAEVPQLISFDTEKEQFQNYPYPVFSKEGDALLHIASDGKGQMWIGTATNGIFMFNDRKKEFLPFHRVLLQRYILLKRAFCVI